MRGEVIFYDTERGLGFITGEDGSRYAFAQKDLGNGAPSKGSRVTFEADGATARSILLASRPAPRQAPAVPGPSTDRGFRIPDISSGDPSGPGQEVIGTGETGLFGYFRRAVTGNYANFRGRARRKEYWGFVLFSLLLIVCVLFLGAAIDAGLGNFDDLNDETPYVMIASGALLSLAMLIPSIAITVRRIHDIGLSGWFILVGFIPSVGNLILLVFALIPSQKHENRWGAVPAGI